MAVNEKELRKQLLALLKGGNSHMDFEEVVADLPPDKINAKTRSTPYSIWHILEHMRIAQRDILDFITDPAHVSPDFPDGYRPRADIRADETLWNRTIARFRADLEAFQKMVKDPETELFSDIPHAPGYTIFRELLLVADHNAYHIGEIALLRQELDAWPPDSPYLTGEGSAVPDSL